MGKHFVVGFLVSAVLIGAFASGLKVQAVEAESSARALRGGRFAKLNRFIFTSEFQIIVPLH